jgi:hypothetical protein
MNALTSMFTQTRRGWLPSWHRGISLGLLAVWAAALPAEALINPRFTPWHLAKGSSRILAVKVAPASPGQLRATIEHVLKGGQPTTNALMLDLSQAPEAEADKAMEALGRAREAVGILFLADRGTSDQPQAALQIRTTWFSLRPADEPGRYFIAEDPHDLDAVWGGSARMLAAAMRQLSAEPDLDFPVRSSQAWGAPREVGRLNGPGAAVQSLDLGGPLGLCALVLSAGGDRLFQLASNQFVDVTARVRLTTASSHVAGGDFNDDGRLDLALSHGKAITLALQNAAGEFQCQPLEVDLPEGLSLTALPEAAPRLLVGTARGPFLVSRLNGASWRAEPLPVDAARLASLGSGGLCVAGDFGGRGALEVLAVYSRGVFRFRREPDGRFQAGTVVEMVLPEAPAAAVPGDFNADGRLDLVVGGRGSVALIGGGPDGQLENATEESAELAYHANTQQPVTVAASLLDVNGDSRQGLAIFVASGEPMSFFNRGFSGFGFARELQFPDTPEGKASPLKSGQAAGATLDWNQDGVPDLLVVDRQQVIRAVPGVAPERPDIGVTLMPRPQAVPRTVTLRSPDRVLGMHLLQPGVPAWMGRPERGPVRIVWSDSTANPKSREILVEGRKRLILE